MTRRSLPSPPFLRVANCLFAFHSTFLPFFLFRPVWENLRVWNFLNASLRSGILVALSSIFLGKRNELIIDVKILSKSKAKDPNYCDDTCYFLRQWRFLVSAREAWWGGNQVDSRLIFAYSLVYEESLLLRDVNHVLRSSFHYRFVVLCDMIGYTVRWLLATPYVLLSWVETKHFIAIAPMFSSFTDFM